MPRRTRARAAATRALRIRRAGLRDLALLLRLERAAFQPYRQASQASLRRSLTSPRQSVWVADEPGAQGGPPAGIAGLLVLWHHRHRVRVYDVATAVAHRGQGLGSRLLAHAEALARRGGQAQVTLEADPREPGLVAWYEARGYRIVARLPAYYKDGRAAVRLAKRVA